MTDQQKEALGKIASAAVAAEKSTGCPAELVTAQGILESGWLKSAPGNNCLGIKAYKGCSGRQLLTTKEWFNGNELLHFLSLGDGRTASVDSGIVTRPDGRKRYTVQDWFATFPDLGACFAKRAAIWDKGPYAKAAAAYRADHNLEALVRGIAPIYATDPKYGITVLKMIASTDLQSAVAVARRNG